MKIFDFLAGCHEDAFGFTTSGKNAWGAAKLYRLTGDARYLDKALLQFQYILDHQHADGYMLGEGVADESGQPKRTTYDYTADFTSWLIDGAAESASRGAVGRGRVVYFFKEPQITQIESSLVIISIL